MCSVAELKKLLNDKKTFLSEEKGKLSALNKQIEVKNKEKSDLIAKNDRELLLKKLIEDSASEARNNGIELLEEILTSSVQTVFGDNTTAKLNVSLKEGIPYLVPSILQESENGTITINPTEADGGGLADILSLSSFMALGQLVEDNFAPNVLDEPTKYVSKGESALKSADFVKNMVRFTKKQTIVSTHDDALLDQRDVGYKLIKNEETGITEYYKD